MPDDMTLGDLPPDDLDRVLRGLADQIAVEREHSHVSTEVRRRLSAIADEELASHEILPMNVLVDRIVGELSPNELKGIIEDWLEMQVVV